MWIAINWRMECEILFLSPRASPRDRVRLVFSVPSPLSLHLWVCCLLDGARHEGMHGIWVIGSVEVSEKKPSRRTRLRHEKLFWNVMTEAHDPKTRQRRKLSSEWCARVQRLRFSTGFGRAIREPSSSGSDVDFRNYRSREVNTTQARDFVCVFADFAESFNTKSPHHRAGARDRADKSSMINEFDRKLCAAWASAEQCCMSEDDFTSNLLGNSFSRFNQ
jgi:hypothetical protein